MSDTNRPKDFGDREFPMTHQDFEGIKGLAYNLTGIHLSDHKKDMVYGRLARRLRVLKMNNFSEYCREIKNSTSEEIPNFINSITTNLTSFFREKHHFDYLHDTVVPFLLNENRDSKRIRFWSAGCSTGEEPYSIAMVLRSFAQLKHWNTKVLATDLDSNVVQRAAAGVYAGERVERLPEAYAKYVNTGRDNHVHMCSNIASLITFKQLNLLHEWPMKGPFDVIFCRNVVIYFDTTTQIKLFDRFANMLAPNGYLFIGHSENLNSVSTRFQSIGRTIYQKVQ